jgi:NADH:ubiquinone oxidoreductase subunit 5 (subunit L)/multisubunit Na+/H+ antiporter MnhA subunit
MKAFIVNRVGDFGFALGIFGVRAVRLSSIRSIFAVFGICRQGVEGKRAV